MAYYHKDLKYHEDTVEKHSITADEIRFLLDLQKEMNTQDTVGQADPRFWVIAGSEQRLTCEGSEDGYVLFNNREAETVARTMKEAYEYIKNKDFENIEEIEFSEDSDTIKVKYNIWNCEEPEDAELDNLEEVKDFLLNDLGYEFSVNYYENYKKIYSDVMFITQKGAEDHLRANYYHYFKDAHTYAMTAWRSPEVERLWKILQEVDWENILQKKAKPLRVGDTVYFIINDNVDPENINGWVVSHPHKVIDVSTLGFFTGDIEEFPYNSDFTKWDEIEKNAFLSKKEALKEVKRREEGCL